MIIINGKFLEQSVTGVQRVGIELVKELDKIVKPNEMQLVTPQRTRTHLELTNIPIISIGNKSGNRWVQTDFAKYVKKRGDMPLTITGLPPITNPGFFVAHDAIFRRCPESYDWKFRLSYEFSYKVGLKRAKQLFTVSEYSRDEMSKIYHIMPDRFIIIYNSSDQLLKEEHRDISLGKWGLVTGEYYLSVGSKNTHKNQSYIYKLADRNPDKVFVITGHVNSKSFKKTDIVKKDNLLFTGYVSDDELYALYQNCKGFIFPSLYEGFGIPPLEAITAGVKKVAVSDIPVFREIYNKGVYYFNPLYVEDFSFERFGQCNINAEEYSYYMKKYSWERSARILYDGIINNL